MVLEGSRTGGKKIHWKIAAMIQTQDEDRAEADTVRMERRQILLSFFKDSLYSTYYVPEMAVSALIHLSI